MATQRVQIPISFQTESTVYAPLSNGGAAQQQTVMIPVPNAPVAVYVRQSNGQPGAPATVYADATSGSQLSSIQTDAGGNVPGYVVEGSYLVSAGSVTINGQVYTGATVAWDAVRGDGVENIAIGAVTTAALAAGSVNLAALAAALQQALVPTGTILDYGGSNAPSGFLLCQGQAVSRSTYSALFGVIGTTFGGGDGSTTFNVPNLAGRVTMGATSAPYALGNYGGALNHAHSIPPLGVNAASIPSLYVNPASIPALSIPAHYHSLSANGAAQIGVQNNGGIVYLAWTGATASTFTPPSYEIISGGLATPGSPFHYVPLTGNTDKSGVLNTNASATGATSTNASATGTTTTNASTTGGNDQAYMGVNKIIKV